MVSEAQEKNCRQVNVHDSWNGLFAGRYTNDRSVKMTSGHRTVHDGPSLQNQNRAPWSCQGSVATLLLRLKTVCVDSPIIVSYDCDGLVAIVTT